MNYIVYKTTNLINGKMYIGVHKTKDPEVFDGYLGCGCYSTKPYSWKQKTNSIFPAAIRKYGPNSFKRETLFIFDGTQEGRALAYLKERELVNENWVSDKNTYNICVGGVSSLVENQSKKIRQYSLSGEYIKTWDSIQLAESYYNNKGQIGKVCNLKHRSSAGYQWRFDSDNIESLDNIEDVVLQKKTVYQFDLSGNLLKVWKSISEAAAQFSNVSSSKSGIKRNCEGVVKQALGYYWSFKNKFLYSVNNKSLPVASYNADGTFIKSYSNVLEACEDLNLKDSSGIFAVIYGKHKTCCDLRWRFFYGNTSPIKPLNKMKIQSDLCGDTKLT